jgi:hypothetical protein
MGKRFLGKAGRTTDLKHILHHPWQLPKLLKREAQD